MKKNYAIMTECGRVVNIVKGEKELKDAVTGIYRSEFDYTHSRVTRKEARQLRKELSERLK